ncbi:unnamed protein product [Cochlearia groenlandica]
MAFEEVSGINGDLVTRSWTVSKRPYKKNEFYHKEDTETSVFFAFPRSLSEKDWFFPDNKKSSFGEIKMKRDEFPCMRSIGNDIDATVNEAFLNTLQFLITKTSFCGYVGEAVASGKKIVFTGHSSGGATAILATVWYLEKYFKKPTDLPEPACVTFGAPLVGDNIFKHALGREKWIKFFTNFVTRFDIVPRIMLAQKSSIEQTLPQVLPLLDPTKTPVQENDMNVSNFYKSVMKDASTVAYQAVCDLTGDKDAFFETLSSFLVLSPYKPIGAFVFSTGTRLVSVSNSDAALQILFYASSSQSRTEQEQSLSPNQSIRDHCSYGEHVQSLGKKLFNHLDLNNLPLDGEYAPLTDLGLSTKAIQCVRATLEAEKQRVDNQIKIHKNKDKIEKKLTWIEDKYKPRCRTQKIGYYDSFKANIEDIDFDANVKRAELAGIFDEVLGLVKKGQLPDEFEGRREWVDLANRYRRLFEPLDISNYHRHLKNEDTGPYMEKGRPNRYKHSQRGYEHDRLKAGVKIDGSICGSTFWAEVEELMGKSYEEGKVTVRTIERLVEVWIEEKEVDPEQMFLEGSTFKKWWNLLPAKHKRDSPLRKRMEETIAIV